MKLSKKLQKLLSLVLVLALALGMVGVPAVSVAADAEASVADNVSSGDIVILYDNDVHCAVDGYAAVAAIKGEMKAKTDYVALVSNGDFVQGATIGALSKGENIVKIMNKVGYDVVTLGNHEFDYQMNQLRNLTNGMTAKVVSCNFMNLEENKSEYAPFTIKKYGDKKVAFVGITTPESITKSTPTYFQNKNGEYIYSFCGDKSGKALYERVQKTVDRAKKKGADYVVALAHLGTDGITARWTSTRVIKNTTGIDVMLDGHSHSTFASNTVKNKDGKDVIVSSTGEKLNNVGQLVISASGEISTQLISLETYTKKDSAVEAYIEEIKKAYEEEISKVIGSTAVDLTTLNPETGERAVRNAETNLGDFCADALRIVLGADIGIMNGGGIRANIAKGDITYNDLLSVFPWSNMGCVVEVTGQQIKDALELGVMNYPEESGGFLHVSGLTYTINSSVASSVKVDDTGMFEGVEGEYRVSNIKVLDSATGKYKKIDLKKTYTLAGINYTLKSAGDGFTMFSGCKVVKDEVAVDNEILITYLTEHLGGKVGSQYENPRGEGRITVK